MTTQSTLGPFMTLILTLTIKGKCAADAIHTSPAEVVKSLLLAQLLTEIAGTKSVGYSSTVARVFRIGSSATCRST